MKEWSSKREDARRQRDRLRGEILATTQAGRQHECILWAGQTAAGIKEILPVATIMRQLIADTEIALSKAVALRREIRHEPTKSPNDDNRRAPNTATFIEISEPDSLGG